MPSILKAAQFIMVLKKSAVMSIVVTFFLGGCSSAIDSISDSCVEVAEDQHGVTCLGKPYTGLVEYPLPSGYRYLLEFDTGVRSRNNNKITLRPDGTVLNNSWFLDDEKLIEKFVAFDEKGRVTIENHLIKSRNIIFSTSYKYYESGSLKQAVNLLNYRNHGLEVNYSENGEVTSEVCWNFFELVDTKNCNGLPPLP